MKVFVYFNLHKKCFSIKALEGAMKGRVVAHRDNVLLFHATFKVSQAGRERVLREKRKNVHAGVCGTWYDSGNDHGTLSSVKERGELVTYNPAKLENEKWMKEINLSKSVLNIGINYPF